MISKYIQARIALQFHLSYIEPNTLVNIKV